MQCQRHRNDLLESGTALHLDNSIESCYTHGDTKDIRQLGRKMENPPHTNHSPGVPDTDFASCTRNIRLVLVSQR